MVDCSSCMAASRKPDIGNAERSKPLGDCICSRFLLLTLPASCTPKVPGSTGQQQQGAVSGRCQPWLCSYPVGR